jgi:hypothetical protein
MASLKRVIRHNESLPQHRFRTSQIALEDARFG